MLLETISNTYYNHLTFVLLLPLIFIFLMCLIDLKRTNLLFRSIFSNQYFYEYTYNKVKGFSVYRALKFGFISLTFSLLMTFIKYDALVIYHQFLTILLSVLFWGAIYFLAKYLIVELFFLGTQKDLFYKQTFMLETSYLASFFLAIYTLLFCFFLHLEIYKIAVNFMLISSLVLYVVRCFKLLFSNKNLLSNKTLYIILYLCVLEIMPLAYLFTAI